MELQQPIDYTEDSMAPIDEELGEVVTQEDTEQSIQEAFMSTGQDVSPSEAKEMLFQSANPIEALIRDKFYTEEMQAEELQRAYKGAELKSNDFFDNPDFFYEQAKGFSNDDVGALDIRAAINSRIEQRILQDLIDRESDVLFPTLDTILDFGAYILRESTIGIPEALTDRTERLGTQLVFNKLNMKPSEYKEWFQQTADEVMQEGIREDDANKIDWLRSVVASNGYDRDASIKGFLMMM